MEMEKFDFERDFYCIMRMAKEMHESSIFNVLEYSQRKVAQFLIDASEGDQWYFNVVREVNTVGFMIGVYQEHFVSCDLYAIDMMLWVDLNSRGTQAATMLVDGYKSWCEVNGVILPMIGSSTGIEIARTKSFYERCGFDCVGHNFILGG